MFSKKLERHIEITAGRFSLVILILFRPNLINNPQKKLFQILININIAPYDFWKYQFHF